MAGRSILSSDSITFDVTNVLRAIRGERESDFCLNDKEEFDLIFSVIGSEKTGKSTVINSIIKQEWVNDDEASSRLASSVEIKRHNCIGRKVGLMEVGLTKDSSNMKDLAELIVNLS